MNRALVLSGGGSRGSYQIGVWQALRELDIRFSRIYGTSIGAINAALVAQGDLALAQELWDNLTAEKLAPGNQDALNIERMFGSVREFLPFLLENAKRLNLDTGPLEAMVERHVNEGRVRASGMKLGVVAVRFPTFQPVMTRLEEMAPGSLKSWLLASAACFPVFRMNKVNGDRYLDGGYSDNLPIDFALREGADEVLAVELHPRHTHPEYRRMPFLSTIAPTSELGGFLDFEPKLLARNRVRGYRDAMKHFHIYEGFLYTFRRLDDPLAERMGRRLSAAIARLDAGEISRSSLSSKPVNAPLIRAMEEAAQVEGPISYRQIFLLALEMAAKRLGFSAEPVYAPDALFRSMLERCEASDEALSEAGGLSPEQGPNTARPFGAELDGLNLVRQFYRDLQMTGGFPGAEMSQIAQFPEHAISALLLHFLKNSE